MPEAANTLQIARAFTHRLGSDANADGNRVPELRPVVQHIAVRAKWRGDGGNPLFHEIARRAQSWPESACDYADGMRIARDYVTLIDSMLQRPSTEYGTRVADEFDHALVLAPTVLLLPSFEPVGMTEMIRLRATAVRMIGLRDEPTWVDGGLCSPGEFFWHDLDHMRFMVREDLATLGTTIPDAYGEADADGRRTTLDPATGRHRCILDAAAAPLTAHRRAVYDLLQRATETVDRLLAALEAEQHRDAGLAAACRLMLFEVCHEKSYTPVPEVLRRELSHDAHLAKIRLKLSRGFWGDAADPGLVVHLDAARETLLRLIDASTGAAR